VNNVFAEMLNRNETAFFKARVPDAPLTDRGQEQAARVARRLGTDVPDITEIWASYLRRALDTAAILSKELPSAKCVAVPDIYEVGGHYSTTVRSGITDS
jgi:broad specificity phosphatase PhoE